GGAAQPGLGPAIPPGSPAATGQGLAQAKGCIACHSIDGTPGVGPTWKGLAGKSEALADGSTAVADAAYLQRSIVEPQAQIVKGFPPVMPKMDLSPDEVAALVAYIQSLSAAPGSAQPTQSQK
ncbi:cytochrome c, partial [Oxalobacteraceae bacterium OM1]